MSPVWLSEEDRPCGLNDEKVVQSDQTIRLQPRTDTSLVRTIVPVLYVDLTM